MKTSGLSFQAMKNLKLCALTFSLLCLVTCSVTLKILLKNFARSHINLHVNLLKSAIFTALVSFLKYLLVFGHEVLNNLHGMPALYKT